MVEKITIKYNYEKPYNKVLHYFFSYPNEEITLTELTKKTKIAKTTANKIVSNLIKEGFLKKKEVGKAWLISLNKNHIYNKIKKIPYNLSLIYEIFPKIKNEILKIEKNPQSMILFGSYSNGYDDEKSDIDIAVEVLKEKSLEIKTILKANLNYRKNVDVNIHIFSKENIDNNLFSNIANGIILDGYIEVKK